MRREAIIDAGTFLGHGRRNSLMLTSRYFAIKFSQAH